MIELRAIDGDNIDEVVALDVEEDQKIFILETTNLRCFADAHMLNTDGIPASPFAIYADNTMIGFLMYIYDTTDHESFKKEALEEDVRSIVSKSRPNAEISVNFKENGDIRPHRNDPRKSGLSELNINFEGNHSFTVTASHAPKIYGASTGWRIRKLTPLECFRLQGFPDSYVTQLREIGISDRQLYKMAGNAVTTKLIESVFKAVKAYI